ncbi:MAG: hypothetical protein WCL51_05620 [Bacteroidota bacterium]
MNWVTKLFKSKPLDQSEKEFFDGLHAFNEGKKLWYDLATNKENSKEEKEDKRQEAIMLFDKAIEKGVDKSEAFSLRGDLLMELNYYFDALEDYNLAIQKKHEKNIAGNYYMRSIIKGNLYDFDGSLEDLKEAIRLSKLDNDDTKYWNNYAKTTGYESTAQFYEMWLPSDFELEHNKKRYTDDYKNEELKKIKRRDKTT